MAAESRGRSSSSPAMAMTGLRRIRGRRRARGGCWRGEGFSTEGRAMEAASAAGSRNHGTMLTVPNNRSLSKSKPSSNGHASGLTCNVLPISNVPSVCQDDLTFKKLSEMKHLVKMIDEVKQMLGSIGDGDITMSAYDTAWVALVPDLKGNDGPQFPSCLQWIIRNQLPDGSWGVEDIPCAYDRIMNTFACIVALKTWSLGPESIERGLLFIGENMWKLAEGVEERIPCGFELVFPILVDKAKALGLKVHYSDYSNWQDIYDRRNLKLKKIPKELMYGGPTGILFSLEGMPDLDWNRLLPFRNPDGSFLSSPSSTAYAFMQTQDTKCLKFLQKLVEKFRGGVPHAYPVDIFEQLWAIDRLQRLGISRYFELEIKECLDHVHRYWTDDGLSWARNNSICDVDDTCMGFRLLRLNGYDVSPGVLKNFEKDGEFFCCVGEIDMSLTTTQNIHSASQVMFPGEDILELAKNFSYRFLRGKQANNPLFDKWLITKDLRGELEYNLDIPFYASLPRIEAVMYLEQYGGEGGTWSGKTLFRLRLVDNDLYLELAKADFHMCQRIHQSEWVGLQKWNEECDLARHGISLNGMLKAYFLAAACIFEPERAIERLSWAKSVIIAEVVASYFGSESCTEENRDEFITDFRNGHLREETGLMPLILEFLNSLASDGLRHTKLGEQQQIYNQLKHAWEDWMLSLGDKEELEADKTAVLLVRTIELCRGQPDPLADPDYTHLAQLMSSICYRLQHQMQPSEGKTNGKYARNDKDTESYMQELLQLVLQSSNGVKQTSLLVMKSYYYASHCSSATLNRHISKVLFEPNA